MGFKIRGFGNFGWNIKMQYKKFYKDISWFRYLDPLRFFPPFLGSMEKVVQDHKKLFVF